MGIWFYYFYYCKKKKKGFCLGSFRINLYIKKMYIGVNRDFLNLFSLVIHWILK